MTVKTLRDALDRHLEMNSGDDEVLFCDDGAAPRYFTISAMGSVFDRETVPAVVEVRREKVGIKCNDNRFPGCDHRDVETDECQNHIGYTYNDDGTISRSQHACPYYNPVYKDVTVQLKPAEYARERIFMIVPLEEAK